MTGFLAVLVVIVHTEAASLLSHAYAFFTIVFERDRHLLVLEPEAWPADWRALAWPASTQRIGTQWQRDQDSVILQVPSAIVPQQHNYLINPQHPHFEALVGRLHCCVPLRQGRSAPSYRSPCEGIGSTY